MALGLLINSVPMSVSMGKKNEQVITNEKANGGKNLHGKIYNDAIQPENETTSHFLKICNSLQYTAFLSSDKETQSARLRKVDRSYLTDVKKVTCIKVSNWRTDVHRRQFLDILLIIFKKFCELFTYRDLCTPPSPCMYLEKNCQLFFDMLHICFELNWFWQVEGCNTSRQVKLYIIIYNNYIYNYYYNYYK